MEVTAKAIAIEVGENERLVRRAVVNGCIKGRRTSPRRLMVSEDELSYLRSNWQMLRRITRALAHEPTVRLAVLHGSTAYGTRRPDSDIDLLVVRSSKSYLGKIDLAIRLEQKIGLSVDIVDLDYAADTSPLLVVNAIEAGRVILDRDLDWPAVVERKSIYKRFETILRRGQDQFVEDFFRDAAEAAI